jgi:hypothetical protein
MKILSLFETYFEPIIKYNVDMDLYKEKQKQNVHRRDKIFFRSAEGNIGRDEIRNLSFRVAEFKICSQRQKQNKYDHLVMYNERTK